MSVDDFIESNIDHYEELMDDSFYSSKTTQEFFEHHLSVKRKLTEELPEKWAELQVDQPMPESISEKFEQGIDAAFQSLKRLFERSIAREKDRLLELSKQQNAIKLYKDEMEKFFANFPNASLKDVDKMHDTVSSRAITIAKEKGGSTLTQKSILSIEAELEQHRQVLQEKVMMSHQALTDPAIGIDLGTTMCCVMAFHKGKVETIPNRAQGNKNTTPSYVAYHEDGSETFGWVAKERSFRFPETTIYGAKRMIGRRWNDENLQNDKKHWPFEILNDNGNPKVKTFDRIRYPHEISAKLLAHFRVMTETHLGLPAGTVRKAVITVPAYFTEPQRRATKEAAQCAGLEVLNILSEPTAAAIAYTWEKRDSSPRKVLVYDLGGGTFDVTIAQLQDNKVDVIAVDGDTHLGGQDIDQMLMEYCLNEFKEKEGIDLLVGCDSDRKIDRTEVSSRLSRIKIQCEKAKETLTTAPSAVVEVDRVYETTSLEVKITTKVFNDLIRPLIQSTVDIVGRALKAAEISNKTDIQDIIMVGGSSRIPLVTEMISSYFDGKQLSLSINPDEAVAYGAAIHAAILNKAEKVRPIEIQDVTPLTLGIEHRSGKFGKIIPRNSKIPCKFHHRYRTGFDNQTSVRIGIYQGESEMADENEYLGEFLLEGIPEAVAGKERLRVIMKINDMGILQVDAVSVSTKSRSGITIKADKLGMNDATIDRICKEITEQLEVQNE